MISKNVLNTLGITRTYNPIEDDYNAFCKLRTDIPNPVLESAIAAAKLELELPFSRLFFYGTNIGETLEEVVGKIPGIECKKIPAFHKKSGKPTLPKDNPVYEKYYKKHNFKPSNFDWLFNIPIGFSKIEVKVIRAHEGKEKLTSEKLYQIQTPLVERALTFAKGSGANGTFQQTKPEFFDFLIGIVIYADQIDFYVVPSRDINCEANIIDAIDVDPETGKKSKGIGGQLILKPQHGKSQKNPNGTYKEGHLVLNQLDIYKKLSVYSEAELLVAIHNLGKYII